MGFNTSNVRAKKGVNNNIPCLHILVIYSSALGISNQPKTSINTYQKLKAGALIIFSIVAFIYIYSKLTEISLQEV